MGISQVESKARSFIVGTAGHVDHGKSELIHRITSVDPDRLPEEKQRKMTIVLGFAPLDLPSGRRCGVVDVPGHEKLVKKMLVGAAGFDLVILVIACDEGPQRQTREHLDILNYLNIHNGVIALTKSDLSHNDESLSESVRNLLEGTTLENAPIIKVSSLTGKGLDKLVSEIDKKLNESTPRPLDKPVFMPLDRKFIVKGVGLIVGGTLWQGKICIGETVEVFPSGKRYKVKSVESFEESLKYGTAGNRYAIRLHGLEKDDINTGNILITPDRFSSKSIFDARVNLATKIKKYTRLKLHINTEEQEVDVIRIGDKFMRVMLEDHLPITRNDRFILRTISPNDTIGGGVILDTNPTGKANSTSTHNRLEYISKTNDEKYLKRIIQESGRTPCLISALRLKINWSDSRMNRFLNDSSIKRISDSVVSSLFFEEDSSLLSKTLNEFFNKDSSRSVVSFTDLKTKLSPDVDREYFTELLKKCVKKPLKIVGSQIINEERFSKRSPIEEKLEKILTFELFSPPKIDQIKQANVFTGQGKALDQALSKFISNKVIYKATDKIFFHKQSIIKGYQMAKGIIDKKGSMKLADFRDKANTTRKYAQALLELLDAFGYTRRNDDVRVLGPKQP
jgi:selenocysteine-specific elongation factor